ncbi:hypothetical protein [Desulfosporosinus sp.]|uniref:hypothetical protein n=1 Tax=Desulfosporosinus sp. TaxID=157907 RepID=UPI0025B9B76C|nr:hypothetical protein [Desulfosporosinus sp.]
MWRKAHSFATKCSFGVGGSAILSTGHYRAFRIPNTEVKNPHCRSVRYKSQCGERLVRLSFQGQGYLGHSSWESRIQTAGGFVTGRRLAKVSTGDFRIAR